MILLSLWGFAVILFEIGGLFIDFGASPMFRSAPEVTFPPSTRPARAFAPALCTFGDFVVDGLEALRAGDASVRGTAARRWMIRSPFCPLPTR